MKSKKAMLYTVVFLIILSVAFTKWPAFHKNDKQEELASGLSQGQLADLPKSATDIKVEVAKNIFSKSVYISFKASKEDIESFINSSSSLNKTQPTIRDYTNKGSGIYFTFSDETVSWFDIKTKKARFYEVPLNRKGSYVTVIIDDDADKVYIRTSHN